MSASPSKPGGQAPSPQRPVRDKVIVITGASSITVGDVQISHLYDLIADFPFPRTLDQAFPAVPAEAWQPYRRQYPSLFGPGNVPRFHAGCYLIRSPGRTILVDTGIGPARLGMAKLFGTGGHLPDRLRSAGVPPEGIDTVMFTHLHPDHVGWNLQHDGGRYRPTFPRARYVAHRADWDTLRRPEVQQKLAAIAPGYVGQTLTPLESLGVLDLADGDHHNISQEVTALHTPGHTPGSMSLLIASQGERAILVGDAIGHPAQIEHPDWGVVDDFDGPQAEKTRRQLLDRLEAEGLVFSASHFPEPFFGRVVHLQGRRTWQPLAAAGPSAGRPPGRS
jgi:glyoxylase-like metal-dependent hydrolase (beta-lactamase superfamily II)